MSKRLDCKKKKKKCKKIWPFQRRRRTDIGQHHRCSAGEGQLDPGLFACGWRWPGTQGQDLAGP